MNLSERERRELSDLASSAADGRITDADAARLQEILLASPEARTYYVRFMGVSSGLAWAAKAELAPPEVIGKITRGDHRNTHRRGWQVASVAAAVLVFATLGTLAFLRPAAAIAPSAAAGIATLSTAMNVEWTDAQEPGHVGNLLKPGWVRMKSGLAQIDFLNGASIWLEGPVEFRLDSAREGYCASGKLVAQVPRGASDFRLDSPYLSVVDKGTGFGVEVSKGSRDAIHVFRGNVQVTARDSRARTELGPGQAMAVDHAGATSIMSADPNAFSRPEFGARWDYTRPYGGPPPWSYGASYAWPSPQPDWGHVSPMSPPPVIYPGQWKGADPMDSVRDLLGVNEKRWAIIRKPLSDFLSEQWKDWGLDNPDEKGVARAKWSLVFAVEDPASSDAELLNRLRALREARSESRKLLETKELSLRSVLTDQEQAKLVTLGYIP